MPVCKKCGGTKRIRREYSDHIDFDPCDACTGPVNGCAAGHASITFHGAISACPLCAALRQLAIVADTELIARRIAAALEGAGKSSTR